MIALIMAGGVGSRFWPLSREDNPKQFLSIVDKDSMIRLTVDRLKKKIQIDDIYIVTAANQVELIKQHIPELPEMNIIIEPFGMNTAPCIALSLAWLENKYDEDEVMLVAAADHLITETDKFYQSINKAVISAENDYLVTFGIKPTYPATSYGYIETGNKLGEYTWQVASFKEKPDEDKARVYLEKGNYFWNSGMFVWNLKTIKNAYRDLQPDIWKRLAMIQAEWKKLNKLADITTLYKSMPRIPVDIGIMEKSENIAVVPAEFGWSDVGGWKALHDLSPKDENSNVFNREHFTIDSKNNYVYADKMVSLIGIENLVIIDTEDVIMIADKDRSEEVKKLVNLLNEKNRKEYV